MKKAAVVWTIVAMVAMVGEWKLAVSMGGAYDKHEYNGIYNSGIGQPYADFIHELCRMAESGNTNRLAIVLRRADEHSLDIHRVWLYDERDAYQKSLDEILK